MSEMVEKVARAIWSGMTDGDDFSTLPADAMKAITSLARDAIAAMREPTEAMLHEGGKQTLDEMDLPCPEFALDAWQVMIDTALSETPKV